MKQKYGQCHICGENTKLSYEHIPPSSAFNKISRKMVGMDILLKLPTSKMGFAH